MAWNGVAYSVLTLENAITFRFDDGFSSKMICFMSKIKDYYSGKTTNITLQMYMPSSVKQICLNAVTEEPPDTKFS